MFIILPSIHRWIWLGTACMVLACSSGCVSLKSDPSDAAQPFSFALIGDMPYAQKDMARFEQLITEINKEDGLAWVLHAGDIKTGGSSCADDSLSKRLALFQRFTLPFVLVPGDNEWTDCHRSTAGGYQPLERLQKLRALFYPEPGRSLGGKTLQMETQAADPAYSEFPEHVRWIRGGVVLVGLHVVGSRNAMAPFEGRTGADDEEAARRMAAAIKWMEESFELAHQAKSPGIFLIMHANPQFAGVERAHVFLPFLTALEREIIRFGKPVLLAHGDSHYFRIDKPLVSSRSGLRIENFTRVETFGAGDVHWLRVTVDPDDENVFIIKQEIVQQNLEQHIPLQ